MAPYQYEPLGSPTTQIRLLELLPGRGGIIQCQLTIVDLEEAVYTYEPISYCWKSYTRKHWWGGSYKEKKKQKNIRVLVDGSDLFITESLQAALRHMRLETEVRVLWADAICINQADDEEKSAQVSMMGNIYMNGRRTLIWLGDADFWTQTAFAGLRRAADPDSDESGDFSTSNGRVRYRQRGLRLVWEICETTRSFLALRSIVNRPYFERAWIFQEILMSHSASVICGKHEILEHDLYYALYNYCEFLSERSELIRHSIVDLWENQGEYCMVSIMSKLSHTRTSDPRDKVYSALGLHQNCEECGSIVVDYSKGVDQVFLDATKVLLLGSPYLDLLSMSYGTTRPNGKDVPSWIWNPDAGSSQFHFSLDVVSAKNPFRASKSSKSAPQFKGQMLGLHGYAFDSVKKVGDVLSIKTGILSHKDMIAAIQCYFSWVDVSGFNEQGITEAEATARMHAFRHALKPLTEKFASPKKLALSDESDARDFMSFHAEIMKRFGKSLAPGARRNLRSRLGLWPSIVALRLLSLSNPACLNFFCYGQVVELAGRCFVVTKKGFYGVCPRGTMPGDRLFLLQGACVPIVLRPSGENWTLVGECYVYRVMHGELWDQEQCELLWIE